VLLITNHRTAKPFINHFYAKGLDVMLLDKRVLVVILHILS
jgi:hypothetical protein